MERKIMVEVTPEEYDKIVSGALDSSCLTNETLMEELLKRCSGKKIATENGFYEWSGQFKAVSGALKINDKTTIDFVIKTRE